MKNLMELHFTNGRTTAFAYAYRWLDVILYLIGAICYFMTFQLLFLILASALCTIAYKIQHQSCLHDIVMRQATYLLLWIHALFTIMFSVIFFILW